MELKICICICLTVIILFLIVAVCIYKSNKALCYDDSLTLNILREMQEHNAVMRNDVKFIKDYYSEYADVCLNLSCTMSNCCTCLEDLTERLDKIEGVHKRRNPF